MQQNDALELVTKCSFGKPTNINGISNRSDSERERERESLFGSGELETNWKSEINQGTVCINTSEAVCCVCAHTKIKKIVT